MSENSKNADQALGPGDTLGIIGGGQLGRMLAMAAARLSLRTIVLDPDAECPASQVCNHVVTASYDDHAALSGLAQRCDRITYEFENIPVSAVQHVEDECLVFPAPNALRMSQDRLDEKTLLNSFGIATADFADITSLEALETALAQFDQAAILKTRRMGYDGKGQFRLHDATAEAVRSVWNKVRDTPVILESMVPFEREISVIVARDVQGNIKAYDPAENVHRDGILRTSTLPASVSASVAKNSIAIASTIVERLAYVGVMGVEFFVTGEKLLVNEIAPRVHNSGHWTEAVCPVSQFEQHVRAVCGLPLGKTGRTADCVMENLIGSDVDRLQDLLCEDRVHIHLYGKTETRDGRKMGHFTRIISDHSGNR